jgi:hypothetical protein
MPAVQPEGEQIPQTPIHVLPFAKPSPTDHNVRVRTVVSGAFQAPGFRLADAVSQNEDLSLENLVEDYGRLLCAAVVLFGAMGIGR